MKSGEDSSTDQRLPLRVLRAAMVRMPVMPRNTIEAGSGTAVWNWSNWPVPENAPFPDFNTLYNRTPLANVDRSIRASRMNKLIEIARDLEAAKKSATADQATRKQGIANLNRSKPRKQRKELNVTVFSALSAIFCSKKLL
jgi:hypothetical protein